MLNGTCPNTTSVVPIGKTIVYQCSYHGSNILPYWNVTGYGSLLNGVPSLRIDGTSLHSGTTYLTVTVDEQFINRTLNTSVWISCGVCDGGACFINPLIPLVEADPVQLTSFGNPLTCYNVLLILSLFSLLRSP